MSKHLKTVTIILLASFGLSQLSAPALSLWPTLVALITVVLFRSALGGLFLGAISGVILMANGHPFDALTSFFSKILLPALSSEWNLSVLIFTLLLGGFAGLLEKGGGFESILKKWLRQGSNLRSKVQGSAFLFGMICFFDGLASALLSGRALRPIADRVGVSRAKLAYLVDSTGSAVACVAVMSTWIAYQLSMIREGYLAAGIVGTEPFILFLSSIPRNFYCWFTLLLVFLTIRYSINLGPMKKAEQLASKETVGAEQSNNSQQKDQETNGSLGVLLPLITLVASLFIGLYWNGISGDAWPISFAKLKQAYGDAQSNLILLYSSTIACIVALLTNQKAIAKKKLSPAQVFGEGVSRFLSPSLVLIAAWCLSGTLRELGASTFLSKALSGNLPPSLFPVSVFALGVLISFTTGTSWGTMGVLMPLTIPVCVSIAPESDAMMASAVAAVFSGAVFGDHCSPLSDTTIVSSIACEINPYDHFRTQLPYALLAASVAALAGFIPMGYGLSPWLCLLLGSIILFLTQIVLKKSFPVSSS
jgi:Na+/H+ antiporter NhaC